MLELRLLLKKLSFYTALHAAMAEPVDALDSGSSELWLMEVQVFLAAIFFSLNALNKGIFLDFCAKIMANWLSEFLAKGTARSSKRLLQPRSKKLHKFLN